MEITYSSDSEQEFEKHVDAVTWMDRPISPPMSSAHTTMKSRMTSSDTSKALSVQHLTSKPNQVGSVMLYGVPIVSLIIESSERLCLAQISNTLLKQFSYNEIHNRRVALGITCVQCTPVQLEILRRAGAMPVSSRRCGMITRREAERLCKSFLGDNAPPRLPDDFAFAVHHECAWGCRGAFLPSRYNSSRAKCIKCSYCGLFFSPNKFIFHSHRAAPGDRYVQPDAANFNSWRRHMKLSGSPPDEVVHAWEDVKAMFNGGTRKRMLSGTAPSPAPSRVDRSPPKQKVARESSPSAPPFAAPPRAGAPFELPLPLSGSLSVMDYVWQQTRQRPRPGPFSVLPMPPYTLPWLKRPPLLLHAHAQMSQVHAHAQSSAFRPVRALRFPPPRASCSPASPTSLPDTDDDEQVDVEHVPADDDMRHEHGRDHERARDPWKRAANYDEEGYSTHSETSDVIRSPFTPQPIAAGGPALSPLLLKVENEEATNEGAITDSSITPEARPYYDPPLKHSIRELTSDTTRYRPPSPLSMYHPRNEPDSYIYANQQRRDALWSVARLSLEYADREKFADIYRPEISRPYAHNKDLDHQSPCSSTPLDCSACHPPQPPPPAPAPATS